MKHTICIALFGILISASNAAKAAESTYFQNLKGLVAKSKHRTHSPAKNTPDLLLLDPKTGAGGVRFGMNIDEVEFGYRAGNVRDQETKGGGFGLTKAYAVTRQFGGRMWIESQMNHGTRVIIRIPAPTK